jgi:predicted alpha/beta hydrolase
VTPQPLAAQAVRFRARDGRTLTGVLLPAEQPRGTLILNSATGFLHEFYLKFGRYCSTRGYHTLLYDYRGMGASALSPLAVETACMSDWGRLDMPAALEWLATRFPALPLFTLGHSVGGQLIGAMDNAQRARAHVMIAASTGYWRRERAPFRYLAFAFWKLYGPWMLRRRGHVPRGFIWRGASLPPAVFSQWRKWCLDPSSYGPELDADLADSRFEQVRGPLLVWGFSDDPIATPAAVEALLVSYSAARIERRWTRPRDVGARSLGHHGFFLERFRDTLWRSALDWIDARRG